MRLRVLSGGEDWTVEADSAMAAVVKAVKTYGFDKLGLIAEVVPEGKPTMAEGGMEGWFVSTERALQEAGINYRRVDGTPNMEPKAPVQ